VLDGAGAPGFLNPGTIIRHDNSAPAAVDLGVLNGSPGVTLRDLRVDVPASAASGRWAIDSQANGNQIENVRVQMLNATDANIFAVVTRARATIDRLTITGDAGFAATGLAVNANSDGTIVRDSNIAGGSAPGAAALSASGDTHVQRSRLSRPATNGYSPVASAQGADLTVDSSLITGGRRGVGATAFADPVSVKLRNTTIDSGSPGVSDPPATGLATDASAQGGTVTIELLSSIAVDRQEASVNSGGPATVTCTSTDAPSQTQSGNASIACSSSAAGNSSTLPAQLFVNAAADDYRLKLGSPAIDSGSPAPLALDESGTDLAGHARVLDGNLDCIPRRDKGAYELTGQSTACPASPGALNPPPAPAPAPGAGAVESVPLVISRVSLTHPVFRTTRGAAASARTRRAPRGTRFLYRLSEDARMAITIKKRTRGRRTHGRCRRPTARSARRHTCIRFVRRGVLRVTAHAGRNSTPFSGWLGRRRLGPGRYRAVLRARNAAGKRSARKRVAFRVVLR
jgi:hypothetical protein